MLAHFFFVATPAKSGKIRFNQKRADALPARRGIGLGEDHVDPGNVSIRDPSFGAVKNVLASGERRVASNGGGLNSRGVGACRRLGQAKCSERFACSHAPQVFVLLRVVGKHQERRLHRGIRHA